MAVHPVPFRSVLFCSVPFRSSMKLKDGMEVHVKVICAVRQKAISALGHLELELERIKILTRKAIYFSQVFFSTKKKINK